MNLQIKLCFVAILLGCATANASEAHSRKLARTIPKKLDVYLLADNTGSMKCAIQDVQREVKSILRTLVTFGEDVAVGVGAYKDVGDDFILKNILPITNAETGEVAIENALDQWEGRGGGDTNEAQLFALHSIAIDPFGNVNWRAGATRIIVWVGDEPGHDPRLGVSEEDAIDALNALKIKVVALKLRSLDSTGQATRITQATGGSVLEVTDEDGCTPKKAKIRTASSLPAVSEGVISGVRSVLG